MKHFLHTRFPLCESEFFLTGKTSIRFFVCIYLPICTQKFKRGGDTEGESHQQKIDVVLNRIREKGEQKKTADRQWQQ